MKRILLSLTVLTVLATQAQAGSLTRVAKVGLLETSTKISSQKRLIELFSEELKIAKAHAEYSSKSKAIGLAGTERGVSVREFARATTKSQTEVAMSVQARSNKGNNSVAMLFDVSGKDAKQVSNRIQELLEQNDLMSDVNVLKDPYKSGLQVRVLLDGVEDTRVVTILKTLAKETTNDFKVAKLSRKKASSTSK